MEIFMPQLPTAPQEGRLEADLSLACRNDDALSGLSFFSQAS